MDTKELIRSLVVLARNEEIHAFCANKNRKRKRSRPRSITRRLGREKNKAIQNLSETKTQKRRGDWHPARTADKAKNDDRGGILKG